MVNFGLFVLRLAFGGLMAGHGAQKLFGWFSGYGLEGTSGWLESMGLRPGRPWAILAGLSEFGGGLLTLLGFLNPIGPIGSIGSMLMATRKVHWGKPIWGTSGGAELPVLKWLRRRLSQSPVPVGSHWTVCLAFAWPNGSSR